MPHGHLLTWNITPAAGCKTLEALQQLKRDLEEPQPQPSLWCSAQHCKQRFLLSSGDHRVGGIYQTHGWAPAQACVTSPLLKGNPRAPPGVAPKVKRWESKSWMGKILPNHFSIG